MSRTRGEHGEVPAPLGSAVVRSCSTGPLGSAGRVLGTVRAGLPLPVAPVRATALGLPEPVQNPPQCPMSGIPGPCRWLSWLLESHPAAAPAALSPHGHDGSPGDLDGPSIS